MVSRSGGYGVQDHERDQGPRHHQPQQPHGLGLPREVLEGIVEVARRHQLMIFADEIYDRLCMDGYEHVSIASLAPTCPCVTL